MKNDVFYFPHFSNTRHERRIMRMEKELGLEAYAIYFKLLEILREQPEFKYPLKDIDLLADEIGSSEQKVRVVICNYQLFNVDTEEQFFSADLNESLQPYLKMKEQRKIAGKASAERRIAGNSTTVQQPFNDRSTTVQQSKVKESKVKESKEKESKEEALCMLGEVSDKYITIQPKYLDSIKYRVNGQEGLDELFQMNKSIISRPEFINKFLLERTGKVYDDFRHVWNDYNQFVNNQFKR